MTLRAGALGRTQRAVLKELAPFARDDGFYLGGGTALALQLGHREKYGLEDCGHVLVALSYFDDADRERLPTMLDRWGWLSVKAAIRAWVREAARG